MWNYMYVCLGCSGAHICQMCAWKKAIPCNIKDDVPTENVLFDLLYNCWQEITRDGYGKHCYLLFEFNIWRSEFLYCLYICNKNIMCALPILLIGFEFFYNLQGRPYGWRQIIIWKGLKIETWIIYWVMEKLVFKYENCNW